MKPFDDVDDDEAVSETATSFDAPDAKIDKDHISSDHDDSGNSTVAMDDEDNNDKGNSDNDADDDDDDTDSERVPDDDDAETVVDTGNVQPLSTSTMPPPRPFLPVATTATATTAVTSIKMSPPKKMRIRLSLKPLPVSSPLVPFTSTQAKPQPPLRAAVVNEKSTTNDNNETIHASMVVSTTPSVKSKAGASSPATMTHLKRSLPLTKTATGTSSKRRSVLPPKQIRLPPLTSPGLLLLRPPTTNGSGTPKSNATPAATTNRSSFLMTPQFVFDATMTSAGYTYEQRTNQPHRGSSVQRTIGDVFDTNVTLSLHAPELVPTSLWNYQVTTTTTTQEHTEDESTEITLPQLLLAELKKSKQPKDRLPLPARTNSRDATRKRQRFTPSRMIDMIPVSLSLPYSEDFIQERLAYVDLVQTREKAIVEWQASQEELDRRSNDILGGVENPVDHHHHTNEDGQASRPAAATNPVIVPPIPDPPDPPTFKDLFASPEEVGDDDSDPSDSRLLLTDYDLETTSGTAQHPIYLPKGKERFVSHLDRNFFHITEGRYFGLLSNFIADPNYVGPNAPGLAAMSVTGNTTGGGLATATTSTTSSTSGLTGGGMTMILSASFHCAAAAPSNKDGDLYSNSSRQQQTKPLNERSVETVENTGESSQVKPSPDGVDDTALPEVSKSADAVDSTTNRSAPDLRKIIEDDSAVVSTTGRTFKDCIVRAAVHAGRVDRKDTSFRAPNGEIYPDLGKAFALYSGVKPCDRCKNNKQGVFHCRIRRRHMDADFDGGSSMDVLKPLFDAPINSLLCDARLSLSNLRGCQTFHTTVAAHTAILIEVVSNFGVEEATSMSGPAVELRPPTQFKGIPEEDAWLFGKLFFTWMRPLFRRATYLSKNQSALEQVDLLPLPKMDHGEPVLSDFERSWKATEPLNPEKEPPAPSSDGDAKPKENTDRVRKASFTVMGFRFIVAGFIKFLNSALQFSFPILIREILKFIEDIQSGIITDDDSWGVRNRGYWLSGILFFAMASKAITENAYFHRVFRGGYQVRVAISIMIYNKALRLANSERQSTTLGELVNLMQVDATKIEMVVQQIHVLWDGMLQIVGYMTILYFLIGWPCFAGLVVMLAAGPLQGVIMQKLFKLNRELVVFSDQRVKKTNEALQGIQSLKMFAWEENFAADVNVSRHQELTFLRRVAYLRGFSRAYITSLPGLVAVTSFVVYALAYKGADITASTLFAALVAFDQLRFPLLFYPMAFAQLAQAIVSAARVQKFLEMKELGRADQFGDGNYIREDERTAGVINISDATVYWSDPSVPIVSSENSNIGDTTHSKKSKGSKDEKSAATELEALEGVAEVKYPKPILQEISLSVNPGELCAVVGRVGSGKSTLCSAILNETLLQKGTVTLKGKVAYASQSPWILNATVRDNILFGQPMDQDRYNKVLQVCQLTHDLNMLDDGDMTEIGEKGINLSGGQKQRVSVARAAYADADVIILDDPLSALDPEVGKQLFDECIMSFMAGKTRLLITNQLQFLKFCTTITALRHGRIIEQGLFNDLIANDAGEVSRLLKENAGDAGTGNKGQSHQATTGKTKEKAKQNDPEKVAGTLVTKEERAMGAVPLSIYRKYLEAGGGYLLFSLVYVGFALSGANGLASVAWIAYWTSDAPDYVHHSEGFYLGIFALLSVTLGIVTFLRAFLLVQFGVRASEILHRNLLDSILRAIPSWFDVTPIGRVLSRFSKDLYSIDVDLIDQLDFFLFSTLQVLISLATIIFVTPWFAISVLPLGYIYITILNYFREVSRETKRLDSISRSPVYAQFSETLGGLSTIRAFGKSAQFTSEFEDRVDQNTLAFYNSKSADRWLSLRLELIGTVVAFLAAIFATNVAIEGGQGSDFSSRAGLSLTFAISLTSILNWCVRTFAMLEAAMNACERVLHYTEHIPKEAGWTSKELENSFNSNGQSGDSNAEASGVALKANGGKAVTLPADWPNKGEIVLTNLRMRYRPETPLVLKGLNLTILGGERVGVVGRTGSGKSSLLLTLLRLVEPSLAVDDKEYQAPITIDGIDILRVGLRDLRSRVGIIPQNPVLFSGTIRGNIDIFDQFSDDQIWAALDKCGLLKAVEEMPGELHAPVSEGGENLSAGMRQMLVLGRALLRQCRVLLLDEATSNVDFETDRAIQKTLLESFPGVTIITIAHRVNTILHSDKILVMQDGLVCEFAPPNVLLADESSTFSDIVRHSEAENE